MKIKLSFESKVTVNDEVTPRKTPLSIRPKAAEDEESPQVVSEISLSLLLQWLTEAYHESLDLRLVHGHQSTRSL
jgi:hypothetical protein